MSKEMLPPDALTDRTAEPVQRQVQLEAPDDEALLVSLLNEIVYLAEGEQFACQAAEVVTYSPGHLTCKLQGLATEKALPLVKAATYHRLKIWQEAGEWYARVVLDV